MSMPMGGGGFTRPPLENAASSVLAAARGRFPGGRAPFPPQVPPKLTQQQQAEALDTISKGGGCGCCGGIHAAEEYGCPRLASFRLDGDGKVVEGTYWPDGGWDRAGIVFATDAAEGEGTDGQ